MSDVKATPTPRHLWIIGIVALLWNSMGAVDYLMTQTKNEAYMQQFSPEQLAFYYGFPAWLVAFWALAVWGAVLGSILLLMRKKLAATVFVVSFVCMLVTTIHNYTVGGASKIMSLSDMFFSFVIFLVALVLVIYSRRMCSKGVLT